MFVIVEPVGPAESPSVETLRNEKDSAEWCAIAFGAAGIFGGSSQASTGSGSGRGGVVSVGSAAAGAIGVFCQVVAKDLQDRIERQEALEAADAAIQDKVNNHESDGEFPHDYSPPDRAEPLGGEGEGGIMYA